MSSSTNNETTMVDDPPSRGVPPVVSSRISFNVNDFTLSFRNVDQLSLQDRMRASWLMEKWLHDYYTSSHSWTQTTHELLNFFILISQDGQEVTGDVNVVSFNAFLSFGSNHSSNSFDAQGIIANPFWDFAANAKFARSLKLDMDSFHDLTLLLDPPVFERVTPTVVADSNKSAQRNAVPSTHGSGKISVWGTALGNTAIVLIIMFHLGAFVFLAVQLVKRLRSKDNDEEDVKSMVATPSQTPSSSRPYVSGAPLGTIREEDDTTLENRTTTDDRDIDQVFEGKFINIAGNESRLRVVV